MSEESARGESPSGRPRASALALASHPIRLRAVGPLLVIALLGALMASGSARARSGGAPPAAAVAGSHLQVTEIDYRLLLSRGIVKAGPVNLETIDRGMVAHDLRLRAASSSGEIAAPLLTPGEHWSGVVDLRPGVYRLWCSLPEHARLGMHTTLTVVR